MDSQGPKHFQWRTAKNLEPQPPVESLRVERRICPRVLLANSSTWPSEPAGHLRRNHSRRVTPGLLTAARAHQVCLKCRLPRVHQRQTPVMATVQLAINLSPQMTENRCGFGDTIGSASLEFTIPQIPGGRSNDPLGVGDVVIKFYKAVNIGDLAPDFVLESLDSNKFCRPDTNSPAR